MNCLKWLLFGYYPAKMNIAICQISKNLTADKAQQIFSDVIESKCTIWVAEFSNEIVGYMAINQSYIDRLYVRPDRQRFGVGSQFIEHAKQLSPQGLELRTHQQNQRARSFYEKHGFEVVEFGISPPPESEPDMKYQWRP